MEQVSIWARVKESYNVSMTTCFLTDKHFYMSLRQGNAGSWRTMINCFAERDFGVKTYKIMERLLLCLVVFEKMVGDTGFEPVTSTV